MRLVRVLLGLACLAGAGFLVFTLIIELPGSTEVAGSRLEPPGKVVVDLEARRYTLWTENGPPGSWNAKTCDGTRNGSPLDSAVEDNQMGSGVRLVPVGGGEPVRLSRKGTCWRVSSKSGFRMTATTLAVKRAGRYRLTAPKRPPATTSFFLSPTDSARKWIRGGGALLLVVAAFVLFSIRSRRRSRREEPPGYRRPPPQPSFGP